MTLVAKRDCTTLSAKMADGAALYALTSDKRYVLPTRDYCVFCHINSPKWGILNGLRTALQRIQVIGNLGKSSIKLENSMRLSAPRICQEAVTPRPRVTGCFRPEEPPRLPDPGLYSQRQRFAAGTAFSFQNPDIGLSTNLAPTGDGEFEVTARRLSVRVTNFSMDAPAAGTMVLVEGARWGIAMPRSPIAAYSVNLGPASTDAAIVSRIIDLDPSSDFGGFFVRVSHPRDRAPDNNEGSEAQRRLNLENGPFSLPFSVHNPLNTAISVTLDVLNTAWNAQLSSTSLNLMPSQFGNIALTGTADVSGMAPSDREDFTVIARVQGQLFGGLTYRLGPSSDG